MLIDLVDASEAREDDENFKNAVDLLFEELEQENPNHFAVRQYKKYKLAAGKTAKSILISCGARLAPFDIKELRDLTSYDELELDTLGEKKTALFVIISDTDATFNFIVSIMYSQLFNLLCDKADDVYNGRLPIHVRCLLDEFANIGQIPQFEKLIATIRSREISASIILQSKSQLKALYRDNASTIEGNCDTTLFLGGKEKDTLKDLAEILGKETVNKDGHRLITIVLGAKHDSQEDLSRFEETQKLMSYCYNNYTYTSLAKGTTFKKTNALPVYHGKDLDVKVSLAAKTDVWLKSGVSKDQLSAKAVGNKKLYKKDGLQAPLKKGQKVGTLQIKAKDQAMYFLDGTDYLSADAQTTTEVKKANIFVIGWRAITSLF